MHHCQQLAARLIVYKETNLPEERRKGDAYWYREQGGEEEERRPVACVSKRRGREQGPSYQEGGGRARRHTDEAVSEKLVNRGESDACNWPNHFRAHDIEKRS